MKYIFITIAALICSLHAYSQNAPFFIWGYGLDGSTYQKTGIYTDTQNGLLIEAPLSPAGVKFPIEFNWRGGGPTPFKIDPNGNVGIGMSNPLDKLHVVGTARIENPAANSQSLKLLVSGAVGFVDGGTSSLSMVYTGVQHIWRQADGQTETMRIHPNGNLGIGTDNPTEKLSVNGKIRAKEIKVEAAPWPDYVFASKYQLPDLKATEQFIKENKHLPEMPSAAEVEKDGVNLGEMNAKLLKKIEEITLYLIDLKKENQEIKKELNELKNK